MKLGYDIGPLYKPRGGVPRYTSELLNILTDMKDLQEIVLYFPWTPYDFWKRFPALRRPGVQMCRHRWPARMMNILRRRDIRWPPIEYFVGPIDVFHSTAYWVPPRRSSVPLVVTVHDLSTIKVPQSHAGRPRPTEHVDLRRLHEANHVIVPSTSVKQEVVDLVNIPSERITVVPYAHNSIFRRMDTVQAQAASLRYGLKGPFIIHLGVIEPRKNLVRLIEAYDLMRQETKLPHRLVFIGPLGWSYQTILERITASPFRQDIARLGLVPDADLVNLLNATDLLVYPSLYEGFGLPPLEAMACGAPIVTSNVSSLPEVVGDAGLLIDPLDPRSIAEGMRRVLENPALRAELRQRGLTRVQTFSWQRTARETLAIYQRVCKELG